MSQKPGLLSLRSQGLKERPGHSGSSSRLPSGLRLGVLGGEKEEGSQMGKAQAVSEKGPLCSLPLPYPTKTSPRQW